MKLQPHLDTLAADLLQSARVGGDDMHAAAERLVAALEPATRLMVLDILSQACAEITAELDSGTVEVRLDGREPLLTVTPGVPRADMTPSDVIGDATGGAIVDPAPGDSDDGDLSRVTIRVPTSVKLAAETRATEAGQSLNTWVVTAMRRAIQPAPPTAPSATWGVPTRRSGRVIRGWLD